MFEILFWLVYGVGFLVVWPKFYRYQYNDHINTYEYLEWNNSERALSFTFSTLAAAFWPVFLLGYIVYVVFRKPTTALLNQLERLEK